MYRKIADVVDIVLSSWILEFYALDFVKAAAGVLFIIYTFFDKTNYCCEVVIRLILDLF